MKKIQIQFISGILCQLILAGSVVAQSKPAGGNWYRENFNSGTLPAGLKYGTDYSAQASGNAMEISIHKDGRWAPFIIELDSVYDFSANPLLQLRARANTGLVLQAFLVDAGGGGYLTELVGSQYKYTELVAGENEYCQARMFKGNDYIDITFDFSGASASIVDLSNIEKIVLTANGTAFTCSGTITVDEISAGIVVQKKAYVGQVPDQRVYKNTPGTRSILVQEIMNADNLALQGGESLIQDVEIDPVTYSTSTENSRAVTYGFTRIHYAVVADATGTDTIVLTATGKTGYANNQVRFVIAVTGNKKPMIDPLDDITCKAGIPYTVIISGISDGNPEKEQALFVTSRADSIQVIDTVMVDYTSDARSGKLIFTPLKAGITKVSIQVEDDEGADSTITFIAAVYENINGKPTIDPLYKTDVVNNAGEQAITLTGISDGDDGSQFLTITAVSTVPGVITDPVVEFNQGDSSAILKFTPVTGNTGTTTIEVTVSDDGGSPDNDGNKSAVMAFDVETLNPPVSGYVVDLSDPDALIWFSPENNSIEYFLAIVDTLGSKALRIKMKDKWTYGGIWFQLPQELYLKQSPVVSYEVFSVQKQTWHWNYFYHAHGTDGNLDRNIQNSEAHQYPAAAGTWTNLLFDYRDPGDLNNSEGEPIDAARINAILLNMHDTKPTWPFTNATATVYYRNIRFGDSCTFAPATPACTIDPLPRQTVFEHSGENTIALTGISNGKGDITGVSISASSYNTNIIPKPSLSPVNPDGTATLIYTADITGSSDITLRVSAPGSAEATVQFNIAVINPDPSKDAIVSIDPDEEKQVIRGFGAFTPEARHVDLYTGDLGASAVRLGIIGNQWEPVNDNDDPDVLNMEGFNYNAFDWDYLKRLKAKGVKYFIVSSWSPPAWMKRNLSLDHKEQAVGWGFTDNRMELYYYDEFAESMLALVKAFREMAGIDILALGLQNEPFFNEPYPSAILDAPHFIELIKIVSTKLNDNGFGLVGFFMPEQVFGIGNADASCVGFLEKLREDAEADAMTGYFAVHGYDQTGITPGFPDYSEWEEYYQAAAEEPNPKEMWMTETTFGYNDWTSSLNLLGAIHGSLWAGNVSWWTTYGFEGDYITGNEPNTSYYAAKNFFRYVRPDAVRVSTGTSNSDIMPTAFINEDGSFVIVLINKSGSAITTRLNGNNLPDEYDVYRTSAKEKHIHPGSLKLSDGTFIIPASSITTLVALNNSVITMNQVQDVTVETNSGESTVTITGISNGEGSTDGLTLSIENANESLFSAFDLSNINPDGTATLTFTPAQDASGFAKVTLTLTDGLETRSLTFFIFVTTATGLQDQTDRPVLVYPNPAKEKVIIELLGHSYNFVRLVDNTGRIVLQESIDEERITLDVGRLNRGLYMLELIGDRNRKAMGISLQ
jgi:O-glycosyl hydrolase